MAGEAGTWEIWGIYLNQILFSVDGLIISAPVFLADYVSNYRLFTNKPRLCIFY